MKKKMGMKKFNDFINENITDLLTGKSDDDIKKELKDLSNIDKAIAVIGNDLPIKYLPKNFLQLKKDLIEKIKTIVKLNNNHIRIGNLSDTYDISFWNNNDQTEHETIEYLNVDNFSYQVYDQWGNDLEYKDHDESYEELNIRTLAIIMNILKSSDVSNVILENFKDLLQGKSDDEIEKKLKDLSDIDRAIAVIENELPEKYLPDNYNELVKNIITDIKEKVIKYQDKGYLTMEELEASSPIYRTNEDEHEYDLIERLYKDKVEVVAYYGDTAFVLGDYTVPYENLNITTLITINNDIDLAIDHEIIELPEINENFKDLLTGKSREEVNRNRAKILNYIRSIVIANGGSIRGGSRILLDRKWKTPDDIKFMSGFNLDDVDVKRISLIDNNTTRHRKSYNDLTNNDLLNIKNELDIKIKAGSIKKGFINESISDLLKGKSDEDVEKELNKLSNIKRAIKVEEFDLPKKHLPDNYENIKNTFINGIKDKLKEFDNVLNLLNDLKLDYDLLPEYKNEDDDGIIHFIHRLNMDKIGILTGKFFNDKFELLDYYDISYNDLNIKQLYDLNDFCISAKYHYKLNENFKDLLTGKSDEEIKKEFDDLSALNKITHIKKYDLPDEWMPSKEEILGQLGNLKKFPGLIKYIDILDVITKYINKYPEEYSFFASFYRAFPLKSALDEEDDDVVYDGIESDPKTLRKVLDNSLIGVPKDINIAVDFIKDLNKTSWMKGIASHNVNENFKDLLVGKSEDEIKNELDKLSLIKRIEKIKDYNFPDKYMPSMREIKKEFDSWGNEWYDNNTKIKYIIALKLPYELLPITIEDSKNSKYYGEERIVIGSMLNLMSESLTKLPDNLAIHGSANIEFNKLTKLPKKLEIFGDLNVSYNKLTELSDDLILHGNLNCKNNPITEIPKTAIIWGYILADFNTDNYINPNADEYEKEESMYENMKSFKQFINENLKDLLKGKSDEEVEKQLSTLNVLDKINYINRYKLPYEFFPSDKEIKSGLDELGTLDRINKIKRYKLSWDFLPNIVDIKKLKPIELLDFVETDYLPNKYKPTNSDLYNSLSNLPKDIKRIVMLYIDDNIEDIGFYITFMNKFETYQKYFNFLLDAINDHIADQTDSDGDNSYPKFASDEEKVGFIDDDLQVEFIGNGIFFTDSKEYRKFIEDLKTTSWYNNSVNENFKDLLKPKSEKELIAALDNVDLLKRMTQIRHLGLPKKYLPTLKELKKFINSYDDQLKIYYIIKNESYYELLPRNENGICFFPSNMNINDFKLTKLPDNLTVDGNLSCFNNKIKELPKGLIVNGHLNCTNNILTELPNDLYVEGNLYCWNNSKILELPDGAIVKGGFRNILN